jgi:hypothetical protein
MREGGAAAVGAAAAAAAAAADAVEVRVLFRDGRGSGVQ